MSFKRSAPLFTNPSLMWFSEKSASTKYLNVYAGEQFLKMNNFVKETVFFDS